MAAYFKDTTRSVFLLAEIEAALLYCIERKCLKIKQQIEQDY